MRNANLFARHDTPAKVTQEFLDVRRAIGVLDKRVTWLEKAVLAIQRKLVEAEIMTPEDIPPDGPPEYPGGR